MCTGFALWSQRDLLGHGPQKRTQCPRDGDHDWVGVFPSGDTQSGAYTQAYLGLPTARVDWPAPLLQAAWQMPADCGGGTRGPGAFDQGPAGMGIPRIGDTT